MTIRLHPDQIFANGYKRNLSRADITHSPSNLRFTPKTDIVKLASIGSCYCKSRPSALQDNAIRSPCGAAATGLEIFRQGCKCHRLCLVTDFLHVTIVHVEGGGLPLTSSSFLLQRSSLSPRAARRRGPPIPSQARLRRPRRLPRPRRARAFGTLSTRTASSPGTASRSTAPLTRASAGRATAPRLTRGPLSRPHT